MHQDFQHARQLYLSGMLYDSLVVCQNILQENAKDADALNLIGMLCYRGGDATVALDYFQQAVAFAPDHAEALGNLALCYKGAGRLPDAYKAYELALALDPSDPQVHYNYAVALRLGHQLERAADHFSRAAELAPLMNEVFNLLGLVRSELNQSDLAILAFRNALAAHPETLSPYLNLSLALIRADQANEAIKVLQMGVSIHGLPHLGKQLAQAFEAIGNYQQASSTLNAYVMVKPDDVEAWENLGDLRFRLGWFTDALTALTKAIALDENRPRTHLQIFSIAQILEDPDLALKHQTRALALTRLFTEPGKVKNGPVLLVLKAPGDWQINTPTDFILRAREWGTVHHYYLDEARPITPDIPECDIIFNAIAEPDRASGALKAAATIVAFLGKPCINDPQAMAKARRTDIAAKLADLPSTIVPQVKCVSDVAELADFPRPFLLRPIGTHAGDGMVLVKQPSDLPAQLSGQSYALPFVDYISADGQYRKYRVVVVGGVPYPFHMGVSVEWMVHYANAKPRDRAQMDREEEAFLTDISSVFSPALLADLSQMAKLTNLDFFAVDCGIHQDGRLVLFEVDAGAIIHTLDNPTLYPYKHTYVPRIFDALTKLIKAKL